MVGVKSRKLRLWYDFGKTLKNIIFLATVFDGFIGVISFLVRLLSAFTVFVKVKGKNGLDEMTEEGLFNEFRKKFDWEEDLRVFYLWKFPYYSGFDSDYFYIAFIAELIDVWGLLRLGGKQT